MCLLRLASDEIKGNDPELGKMMETHITDFKRLLEVVNALKSKLVVDDLNLYFEVLKPFIEKFKPTYSQILKLSHIFCNKCDIYIPSLLKLWAKNNPELFSTEIYFYHRFFTYFHDLKLKNDIPLYSIEDFYCGEDLPLSGQTSKEKLKLLNSVIKHYDFITTTL